MQRRLEKGIGDYPAGNETILELIHEAEAEGLVTHSVYIEDYAVDIQVKGGVSKVEEAMKVVRFEAVKAGTFDIFCNTFCGYGHPYMREENAFVVVG